MVIKYWINSRHLQEVDETWYSELLVPHQMETSETDSSNASQFNGSEAQQTKTGSEVAHRHCSVRDSIVKDRTNIRDADNNTHISGFPQTLGSSF